MEAKDDKLISKETAKILTLPFDEFQRYKVVADIINKFRKNKEIFKILEVGAGGRETLKRFLPHDNFIFLDKELPPQCKQKSNYILGDITKMHIVESYDFVVSIDTYEHISPSFRERFINGIIRPSNIATVIAAPFDTSGVKECEVLANEVYKLTHGTDYRWLSEHIQNGLPSFSYTLELIKKLKLNYMVIPNGYLLRWFEMISVYLLTEGMTEFSKVMEELYEFYNKNFYQHDNTAPAYRQIIVINKKQNPDFSDILTKDFDLEDFEIKYQILQSIIRKIKELYNTNTVKYKQISELTAALQTKATHISELDAEIERMVKDIGNLQDINLKHQKREEKLTTALQAKDAHIGELDAEIERMVKGIGSLQNINLNHQKREEELTTSLQAKATHISELDAEIERMVKDIENLQNINLNHQKREEELTTSLQAKDAHIREIEASILWHLLTKYQKFVEALLPLGTSRRRYYDAWLLWMRSVFNRNKNFQRENKVGITQDAYNRTKNVDIICFPIINWDFRYQRTQQLLSRFAKNGYRVFYLTVDLMPLNRKYIAREIQKNVLELKPSISTKFNVYRDTLSKEQIDSLISATDQVKKDFNINRALCFAAFPTWGPVVSKLRDTYDWKIIYDCLDEHSGFSNVDNSIVQEEEMLIKKSDLVIVTSSYLYKKVKKYRNDALLIPNAGDFEHFSELPKNNLLKNIKKPIIGYYGAIAEWFDNELLEFLANKRKDWNFVLIGHTFGSNIGKLQKFHNVHFLGEKPYSELPKYLYWFDVCIIPFKITPLIEATHPVKFYEYLSSGKPVVSAKLPELLPYNDLCYLADSKEDFLNKIEIGLKEDNLETKRKRIEFAKSNTWDDRYEILASHAKEIFDEVDN